MTIVSEYRPEHYRIARQRSDADITQWVQSPPIKSLWADLVVGLGFVLLIVCVMWVLGDLPELCVAAGICAP